MTYFVFGHYGSKVGNKENMMTVLTLHVTDANVRIKPL